MRRKPSKAYLRSICLAQALLLPTPVPQGSPSVETVSFIARRDFAAGPIPRCVAVGDFNGDGVQDLAVANYGSNNVSVLLGNGDGTFQEARHFGAGRNPQSVAVGDFNADGMEDLAVANYDSDNVSVLINNTTKADVRSLNPRRLTRSKKQSIR